MTLQRTTKLEAVNEILSSVGGGPVNSLTSDPTPDVAAAERLLDEVSREMQSRGWSFNTELNFQFIRNTDNEIVLEQNVLEADIDTVTSGAHGVSDWVQRGTKLYDRVNNTFTAPRNLEGTVVRGLEFDELPEAARRYIALNAARRFEGKFMGDQARQRQATQAELDARAELERSELRNGDFNSRNGGTARFVARRGQLNRLRRYR